MLDADRHDERNGSANDATGGPNERRTSALLAALRSGGSVGLSVRNPALSFRDAYAVAGRVRAARVADGARTVGRKIGFTNAELAAAFSAPGPIWGWVYDRTLVRLADHGSERTEVTHSLAGLCEPRLEPEIVLELVRAPSPGMNDGELAACIGRAALGFEVVQSVFPDWRFTAAEAVAGHGLHGALIVGPDVPLGSAGSDRREDIAEASTALQVRLERDGDAVATGAGANAHGGPMRALRWLVDELDRTGAAPLAAGEVVTTGTLTGAHPIAAGETWRVVAPPAASAKAISLAVRFI